MTIAADKALPQYALLGFVLQIGKDFSRDGEALGTTAQAIGMLSGEMFDERERAVFEVMCDLLAIGRPAAAFTIIEHAPALAASPFPLYMQHALHYPDIQTASEAVQRVYHQGVLTEWASQALRAAKSGELEQARGFMEEGAAATPLRALQEIPEFESFQFNPQADARISTGFPRIDRLVGGGLGYGGRNAMSLWVAPTNVGKSTVAQQVSLSLKEQGHHVLYFSGEASRDQVNTEFTRLGGQISFDQMSAMSVSPTGFLIEKTRLAIERVAAMSGKLQVWDEDFDGALIRAVAGQKARDLDRMYGETPDRPRLVVVVDNIDHAIEYDASSRLREDQLYDREARAFLRSAQTGKYHIMLLSQSNADGDKRDGAPFKSDVAAAKKLVAHVGMMISLYRPTTDADLNSEGRRSKHWVAVRKQRGGRLGELEFASNSATGIWIDPQQTTW